MWSHEAKSGEEALIDIIEEITVLILIFNIKKRTFDIYR